MTGVDGVRKAGSSRGARNIQATDDGCDNEERRDEAEEEHEEATIMLPATSGPLAALHARGADTRASGRPLSTRRAANPRGLFSLRRHGQCRRGHAPLVRYLFPCRVHDAHRRAAPVVMDGNARALIALDGHPSLVQMRVLTRGRGRFRGGRSLHGHSVARNDIALRRYSGFLRRTRVFRLTRGNRGLASNHRDLGGHNLFNGGRLGRARHRRQARLLAQTRGHGVGRILLRHLSRTDSIRVRRPGPHNSSINN